MSADRDRVQNAVVGWLVVLAVVVVLVVVGHAPMPR